MRYIKDIDYASLWGTLERKISDLAAEHDWAGATSACGEEQLAHYCKKEMCNEITVSRPNRWMYCPCTTEWLAVILRGTSWVPISRDTGQPKLTNTQSKRHATISRILSSLEMLFKFVSGLDIKLFQFYLK